MEASNPYSPPSAPVRDIQPAGVNELAGRGTRLGATLLDGLIAGLLIYVPFVIALLTTGAAGMTGANGVFDPMAFLSSGALLALVPGTVIYAAITIWLVVRNGQTIGKKLLAIKVVRTSGEKAGLGRIFWLRNVVISVISAIPIAGGIVALIDILLIFRESRKCLHDQIADTIVVTA
jgi:uncharacterized RDD family membrane protein YckC